MRAPGTLVLKAMAVGMVASLALLAQSGASIEGRVTNSVTGEPVIGAKVRFVDSRSSVYSTVTDSTGSYRLTELDDGEYRGDVTRPGFANSDRSASRVAGLVPVKVDVQLKPWASLRGRVVNEDGTPAPGVRVEMEPRFRGESEVTNDGGEFAFADLTAGSFVLVAKPPANIYVQEGMRMSTMTTYYPAATDPTRAARISVQTGQDVSGLEIKLVDAPVHRVAGVVLNDAGKPAGHAALRLVGAESPGGARQLLGGLFGISFGNPGGAAAALMPLDYAIVGPGAGPEIARVESLDDGTFEFPAVAAGDWRLNAERGLDDDMARNGVASVLVSDHDIDGVQIRLAPSFLPEMIIDGAGPANTSLGLTSVEGQPRVAVRRAEGEGLSQVARQSAFVTAAAEAVNSVYPGRYRVLPLDWQPGFYVAAVMWGGRDVNRQEVDLAPGAPPFQVMLRSNFGGVHGNVEKGDGATVLLVSRESGEIVTYRQTRCRAGGSYDFGNVPPGDYYAVAFDRTDRNSLAALDLGSQILPVASSVRVIAGSKEAVDLKVNKWPW